MMVNLEALSFIRRGKSVLSDVTAVITDGALTCLVGPNGAGKTTLLSILAGELRATSGGFLIDGRDASALSQKEATRYFSIIPQDVQPPPHFTVFELVLLGRMGRFQPRKSAFWWRLSEGERNAIHSYLARCQIESLSQRRAEELSGGEQQRAWLAFALAQEKKFLLLDETLDGLDIIAKQSFFRLLKEIASEGKGVLLTSHDLDLVAQFADKVIVLNGGKVSYEGPPHAKLRFLFFPTDSQRSPCQ
jgi:ABC-type cobalamin/Fe3+-siderophores transport system ATPase subunit